MAFDNGVKVDCPDAAVLLREDALRKLVEFGAQIRFGQLIAGSEVAVREVDSTAVLNERGSEHRCLRIDNGAEHNHDDKNSGRPSTQNLFHQTINLFHKKTPAYGRLNRPQTGVSSGMIGKLGRHRCIGRDIDG